MDATYGAPGEVDDQGVIRKICVVPKPYQQPHPPLFQPFSVSENDHPLHRAIHHRALDPGLQSA